MAFGAHCHKKPFRTLHKDLLWKLEFPIWHAQWYAHSDSLSKEYEIITLIYKGKTCSLDLLCFCAPENMIL